MNKVLLIGRLVKDPDLRFIPDKGTPVVTITLATDKYNRQAQRREADFINVVIWGKQAESTANCMSKGSQMAISGRIQTRSYDAKDGSKRYVTEVVADEVQFLGKGTGNQQSGNSSYGSGSEYGVPSNDPFGGMNYDDMTPVDDGDVPF